MGPCATCAIAHKAGTTVIAKQLNRSDHAIPGFRARSARFSNPASSASTASRGRWPLPPARRIQHNQPVNAVDFDERGALAVAMLLQPLGEGIGHPDIEGAVTSAGENVNVIHAFLSSLR